MASPAMKAFMGDGLTFASLALIADKSCKAIEATRAAISEAPQGKILEQRKRQMNAIFKVASKNDRDARLILENMKKNFSLIRNGRKDADNLLRTVEGMFTVGPFGTLRLEILKELKNDFPAASESEVEKVRAYIRSKIMVPEIKGWNSL